MPQVSVLIPCYHSEAHLPRAMRSLLAQTLTDWEAILISDDGVDYAAILKQAGIDDPRISHVSTGKMGSGPGNARNAGLDQARAPIIAHLDADDEFEPSYLAIMLPLVQKYGLVMSAYQFLDDATGLPRPNPHATPPRDGLVTLGDLPDFFVNQGFIFFVYDRLRVPVRWPEDLCEDMVFLFSAFNYLAAIYTTATPLYRYYKRAGSLTHSATTAQHYIPAKQRLLTAISAGKYFSKPEVKNAAEQFFIRSLAAEKAFEVALAKDPKADFLLYLRQQLQG